MTQIRALADYFRDKPFQVWVVIAVFFALTFLASHGLMQVSQSGDYHFLTARTTFNMDTMIYAAYTSNMLETPGLPSDVGLYEYRGKTSFAFVSFAAPACFASFVSLLCGGDVEAGYKMLAFLGILAICLALYPLLRELSCGRMLVAFFMLTVILTVSVYSRWLTGSIGPVAWKRVLSVFKASNESPYYYNEFFRPNNIQVSFIFHALFLSSFVCFLKGDKGRVAVFLFGVVHSMLYYSYLYYVPQGMFVTLCVVLYLLVKRDMSSLKPLLCSGAVTAVLMVPFVWVMISTLISPVYPDIKARFGMTPEFSYMKEMVYLTVFSLVYVAIKYASKTFNVATFILFANLMSVPAVLLLSYLFSVGVQTGHLVSRAFYPIMGLAFADLIVSFLSIVVRLTGRTDGFMAKSASSVLAVLSVLMICVHLNVVANYVSVNKGLHSLSSDTVELLEWFNTNTEADEVVLSHDLELILLLQARCGNRTFLTYSNTTVAPTSELKDRVAWAYALCGIKRAELERRLSIVNGRSNYSWEKRYGKIMDYDRMDDSIWGLFSFGRTYWHSKHHEPIGLSPEESSVKEQIAAGKIREYIPVRIRNEVQDIYDAHVLAPASDCPYKLDYIIVDPYVRRNSEGSDARSSERYDHVKTIGRFDVLKVRS